MKSHKWYQSYLCYSIFRQWLSLILDYNPGRMGRKSESDEFHPRLYMSKYCGFLKMCYKIKEDVFPMLLFYTSIFLSISICKTAIVCPNVSIENGSTREISCESDRAISDFYWYRGHYRSISIPILILDSEGKGGTEYGSDHFEISSNGSMILKDVIVEHESNYTFVGFYENRQSETATFVVYVTIPPDPRCPLVQGCEPCIECELFDVKKKGTLTCEIEGARPLLPLTWNITSKKGIDFVRHHPEEKPNPQSDSWDTSVSLDYTIEENCGVFGEIYCVADDSANILQSRTLAVSIRTGPCNPGTAANLPLDEKLTSSSPEQSKTAAVLAPVLLIILFGVLITVAIIKYRYRKKTEQGTPRPSPLLQSDLDSESAENFIRTLKKESREKFCFLQPLPWGYKINVEHLYTESFCKVTTQNGETLDVTSTELTKTKIITNQRLVTFVGDHGDGRTTFFKNVVYEWSKGMEDLYLVVFIPLKEVRKDKSLSKYLTEDILNTNKFDIELEAILNCEDKHCLVILDGLEDLSFGKKRRERNTEDPVTIAEILQGPQRDLFKNFHVWISSREEDLNSFPNLKHHVKVEMKGISIQLINEYIKKCCRYYFNNVPGALNKDSNEERNDVTEDDKDLIEEDNDVYCKVQNFFKENNILEDFGNRPLLINLMVHIMARNFTSGIADLPKNTIKNMGLLLHVVIKCMKERHQNKFPTFSDEQFSKIKYKLGKIAVRYETTLEVRDNFFWAKEIGDQYLKTACEIGLLKIIKNSKTGAKFLGIKFYHQYIQEYLAALAIIRNPPNGGDWKQTIENWGNDNSKRLIKLIEELNDFERPARIEYVKSSPNC